MTRKTRRDFLGDSLLAASTAAAVPLMANTASAGRQDTPPAGEKIRIGVVGVRGRGRAHVNEWRKSPDAEVVAICDPDEGVIEMAMKASPGATYYKDIRKMLEDPSIHAVSIASPNHWHALGAIWAIQAGKHVYVEKPVSHNVFEGRQVVEAARIHERIVQHGTQARSQPACRDAIAWLHAGNLGKVQIARGLCYKSRGSIGKVSSPQAVPKTCDFDLWTGPAELRPLMRKNLHYDWHWDFNTGNGDMGNQGVHQMDLARWGLGVDQLPTGVVSCGARLGYVDDANTPNTQVCVFDYGEAQMVFETRGLPTPEYYGAKIGTVFHCEKGYLTIGSYSKCHAYDLDGNVVQTFQGSHNHFQNFLDAIKAGDASVLNAPIVEGHLSSALCHLGNVSYLLGQGQALNSGDHPFGEDAPIGNESFQRFREHLAANKVDLGSQYSVGPQLRFDPQNERFVGEHSGLANQFATRNYRGAYSVPDKV